ncbi:MAG: hypothetical protein HY877_02275 [Deltaproteobacteria bacterium]|nr:hypothetical protein [Deltaproteobacteria bacterium]
METKEIEDLFERLAKQYGVSPEESKPIFTLLVKTTLKYRDMLMARGEKPLTVEETRAALDELLHVMNKKSFSPNISPRIHELVQLWHDEVKIFVYN